MEKVGQEAIFLGKEVGPCLIFLGPEVLREATGSDATPSRSTSLPPLQSPRLARSAPAGGGVGLLGVEQLGMEEVPNI